MAPAAHRGASRGAATLKFWDACRSRRQSTDASARRSSIATSTSLPDDDGRTRSCSRRFHAKERGRGARRGGRFPPGAGRGRRGRRALARAAGRPAVATAAALPATSQPWTRCWRLARPPGRRRGRHGPGRRSSPPQRPAAPRRSRTAPVRGRRGRYKTWRRRDGGAAAAAGGHGDVLHDCSTRDPTSTSRITKPGESLLQGRGARADGRRGESGARGRRRFWERSGRRA